MDVAVVAPVEIVVVNVWVVRTPAMNDVDAESVAVTPSTVTV